MRILHLKRNLDYGGAETLLMSYLPMLPEFEHIVVAIQGPNVYYQGNYEYIQLDMNYKTGFFKVVKAIKVLIKEKQIDIVHSHGFWTNIISRYATPKNVRLFNHYHFADYDTLKHKLFVKRMIVMDKLAPHKNLFRIGVSEYVGKILNETFPGRPIKVIPNFITCGPGQSGLNAEQDSVLKIIAVGNCNLEKNYELVLRAFKLLENEPVHIDIIGGGGKLDFYREEVLRLGLQNVNFLGHDSNVRDKLKKYDLYLSTSFSETFGISVLEAVCARLPLLLSAIPAFKEISPEGTVFFDPHNEMDLANRIREFDKNKSNVDYAAYDNVLNKYSATRFIKELREVYALA